MFSGHSANFILCFVCMVLYCVLVQGSEETEQKQAPKFHQEPTGTATKGFKSTHHEKAKYPVYHNEGRTTNNISNTSQRVRNAKNPKTFSLDVTNTSLNNALRIVTLIGFSVSTTCHFLVLITYGLFRQLRNVPGLNLMNLCISLALSQFIWPIAISYFDGTMVCEALAVLEHYLHKASFLAITVISYHTWYIFSQPIVGRITNRTRSKFIKYSITVWLSPAVFLAICIALDKTQVFPVDYGTNCWIGNANARLYLYIIPLSLVMLYSIYKFIQTAVSLSRHYRQTHKTIQRKKGKENLLVCAKLAALVSCPCLLSFFAMLFPDVEALRYLYVVSVCLQAVYIAQLLLLNKRTVKLYKDWWRNGKNVDAGRLKNVARPTADNVAVPLTNTAFQIS